MGCGARDSLVAEGEKQGAIHMALEVIAAGLGRNATFSMKFALEHLGFGPCHHMMEVFADGRRQVPLWVAAAQGEPDWDSIFDGFRSTSDYPSANYWRELADYYPDAKVVLTDRDPDNWFDSVSQTIFSPGMLDSLKGTPLELMLDAAVLSHFGGDITDRKLMTQWYVKRNREVMDSLPPERLLHFRPGMGWQPLCDFLGVEVPEEPFPRVNSREEMGAASEKAGGIPADPDVAEQFSREYIAQLKAKAFG